MIPRVDPQVKYVGTTYLRSLNSDKLRGLSGAVVVQAENSDPLAVILPYQTYLKMQKAIESAGKFEARFWEGEPFPVSAAEEVAEEFQQGIFKRDDDDFDEKRNEVRSSIKRGARQMPRTLRQKGDGKR